MVKLPGVKRPAMADVTNTHMNQMDGAGDPKKPKIEGVATTTAGEEAGVADQAPVT